ncbi:hypothetical protein GPJ61_11465 [Brevibacillus formosus]|uniref:beta family protein n=1 Tax=Brevibacillus formosus TaxID=54913 RepID=UPI001CA59BB4|nr:beta family protein [Brevibacillus formosus]MBW5468476.1 hypothetical protein [Brevibacillus formosus]
MVNIINFKYVPVLRFRDQERKAFLATSISDKMIPLVEIFTEKMRSNGRETSIEIFSRDFANVNTSVMLDFPLYLRLQNNTKPAVRNFSQQIQANPALRINYFLNSHLIEMGNIIPVITYNPNIPYRSGALLSEERLLRQYYDRIAVRVFPQQFSQVISEAKGLLRHGDIFILEIDELSVSNPEIAPLFIEMNTKPSGVNYKTVLIRSAIPRTLTNTQLSPGQVVLQADNSLLRDYPQLGFDAFGDFVGVKKDDLTEGGRISPGYLMYSWQNNHYIGFNGVVDQPATFETMIVPDVLSSNVWPQFAQSHHHSTCFGCSTISNISNGTKSGQSQPEWKGFTIGHYLYTMQEFL